MKMNPARQETPLKQQTAVAKAPEQPPVAGVREPPGPNLSSADQSGSARQRHGHARDAEYQLRGTVRHAPVGKLPVKLEAPSCGTPACAATAAVPAACPHPLHGTDIFVAPSADI